MSSRAIIVDLRAQAAALEGGQQSTTEGVARTLRRAADEIERLLDAQFYLRAALDLDAEDAA